MSQSHDEMMQALFAGLSSTLLAQVKSGEATAATLNVARQFLKDNGYEARVEHSDEMKGIAAELPEFDDELGESEARPALKAVK